MYINYLDCNGYNEKRANLFLKRFAPETLSSMCVIRNVMNHSSGISDNLPDIQEIQNHKLNIFVR